MLFRNGRGSPHVIPITSGCNKKSIIWTIVLVEMLPGVVSQGTVYKLSMKRPVGAQVVCRLPMEVLEHV